MDNVEVYNCSQANTFKAAIRFEGVTGLYSSVTNSAIHNGLGWGVHITSSSNIHVHNNVIFNFKPIGVGLQTVQNVTFEDNIVAHIYEREISKQGKFIDKRGAVAVCSLNDGNNC